MQIERRALYNSLRMNWLRDPKIAALPWQVEDYRILPVQTLFDRLQALEICLDRVSFLALSENVETPEDLTDDLVADSDVDAIKQDQIYLIIFELWRRLVPEKQNISIFCDELDHHIDLYDRGLTESSESIQDILANFAILLDENTDEGGSPNEAFLSLTNACAHDIETFLYDFIADQIDSKHESYASELLDDFSPYISDTKWFDLLKIRLLAISEAPHDGHLMRRISHEAVENPDLEFNFEVLASLVQGGAPEVFRFFVNQSVPLLDSEEDFQDLLVICADYFHFLDREQKEQEVQSIIDKRSQIVLNKLINKSDPDIKQLVKLFA
jgi:hypothetical protein